MVGVGGVRFQAARWRGFESDCTPVLAAYFLNTMPQAVIEAARRFGASDEMDDSARPREAPGVPKLTRASQVLSDRDLAMQFESLGGSGHGCEFGLFQRHFGAEPLGLLRWADLGDDLLIKALESRFEGVGLTANTIVFNPEHSDEWWTRDTRYWMAMRSFVKTADVNLDEMTVQVCRRLQFLRRKLIEDLEAGEKIFSFKNMYYNLTDVDVARLHAAVRSYGHSTLFYVRYADDGHPAGTVEAKEPGLLIGYIDHFAFSPDNKLIMPVNDAWLALCDRAYRTHRGLPTEAETTIGPSAKDRQVFHEAAVLGPRGC
jgi:hypothetical protein